MSLQVNFDQSNEINILLQNFELYIYFIFVYIYIYIYIYIYFRGRPILDFTDS